LDRRPDPLWWMRPRHSRRFVFAVIVGVTAVYLGLIALRAPGTCSASGGGPCGALGAIVATVTPISPLSVAVCAGEMRRWGYSHSYAVEAVHRPLSAGPQPTHLTRRTWPRRFDDSAAG